MLPILTKRVTSAGSRRLELCLLLRSSEVFYRPTFQPHLQLYLDLSEGGGAGEQRGAVSFLGKKEGTVMT